jgi:hypothetical protein
MIIERLYFDERGPVAGFNVREPQARTLPVEWLLQTGRSADINADVNVRGHYSAGRIFLFMRKRFCGSHFALTFASRS